MRGGQHIVGTPLSLGLTRFRKRIDTDAENSREREGPSSKRTIAANSWEWISWLIYFIFGLYSIVELSSKSNKPRNNVAFKVLYFRSFVPSDFY
jgi:hypothetical protein